MDTLADYGIEGAPENDPEVVCGATSLLIHSQSLLPVCVRHASFTTTSSLNNMITLFCSHQKKSNTATIEASLRLFQSFEQLELQAVNLLVFPCDLYETLSLPTYLMSPQQILLVLEVLR